MTDSTAPVSAIEKEFGVPIPGAILPEDQWAKTALKKVPEGLLNWAELFGRVAPVLIDVGCGHGDKLKLASQLGWQARGIELDASAVQAAQAQGVLPPLLPKERRDGLGA